MEQENLFNEDVISEEKEKKSSAKKEASFEENIVKLEGIVKELESGACSLDTAIEKFTEGMKLAKICGDKLSEATESVNKILTENGNLEDFQTPSE